MPQYRDKDLFLSLLQFYEADFTSCSLCTILNDNDIPWTQNDSILPDLLAANQSFHFILFYIYIYNFYFFIFFFIFYFLRITQATQKLTAFKQISHIRI